MKRSLKMLIMCLLAMTVGVSTAYADDVVKITIATHVNPGYEDIFPQIQKFADRINEMGKGRIKSELHHSESLFKVKELIPGLMKGACDIIFYTSSSNVENWPELGGLGLPFLYKDETDCRNHWMSGKPLFEFVNEEMIKKYGVKILAPGIIRGMVIATIKKAVEKPEDLKGLRLRATGRIDGDYIKACGGIPLFLGSPQMNEAIKKEILDGIITYPGNIFNYKLEDKIDFITETRPIFVAWGFQIYVLSKNFNQFSKEVQDVITQAASEYDRDLFEKIIEYEQKKTKPILDKNIRFIYPNVENMKQFKDIAKKNYDEWSKTVDPEFAKKFIELSQMQ